MKDFRAETFYQFIYRKKLIFFLRFIWIFIGVVSVVIFIKSYKTGFTDFWTYLIFIIIGLTLQSLFVFSMLYKMYSFGRKAFLELSASTSNEIIYDVPLLIRGFDLLAKPSLFSIDIGKTVYQFDQADIILGSSSMILLGKIKLFGAIGYASPVEIITSIRFTSVATAILLQWTEERGRVVIELKDKYYSKPFKIEFKDHTEQIKLWLTIALPKVG